MQIVSLLPSITEIVYALGLGDALVGVTHECDYPSAVRSKAVVTRSALNHSSATSAEIDAAVRAQLRDDLSIYDLDRDLLASLHPDVILTQALCDVCAVSFSTVRRVVRELTALGDSAAVGLATEPQIISLEPTTLSDILATISAVGEVTGRQEAARSVICELEARIARVSSRTADVAHPRVACLEWLDPPFGPGHWLPELITLAGGLPGLGTAGQSSQRISWGEVIAFAPEVIVLTPCGFDLERTVAEAEAILPGRPGWQALPAVRNGRVFALDGNAYCSRPGPRIVDSLEMLVEIIHPELRIGSIPVGAAVQITSAGARER